MLDQILEFDYFLFELLNQQWRCYFFDILLPIWREKEFWIPLYLVLLVILPYRFGRGGWWLILAIVLSVSLSDIVSSHIVKPFFDRLRPCNDPSLQEQVVLLVNCGSGRSFTSSHAANHFSIACALGIPLLRSYSWALPLCLVWALSIAYGQVYVGVHFPLDIFFGGILGIIIGGVCGSISSKRIDLK